MITKLTVKMTQSKGFLRRARYTVTVTQPVQDTDLFLHVTFTYLTSRMVDNLRAQMTAAGINYQINLEIY